MLYGELIYDGSIISLGLVTPESRFESQVNVHNVRGHDDTGNEKNRERNDSVEISGRGDESEEYLND